jgi:tetratricopeptide (TPR) repeat protein
MMEKRFLLNAHYREYVRLLIALHQLFLRGEAESEAADQIRDQMDEPWKHLKEDEIKRVRGMSADLYSLEEDAPLQHPQVATNADDAFWRALQDARNAEDYELALKLMREQPQNIDAAKAAVLRAICYERLGDAEIAVLFYTAAIKLLPRDENRASMVLIAFQRLGRVDRAVEWASKYAQDDNIQSPALIGLVANILREEALRHKVPDDALLRKSAQLLTVATSRVRGVELAELNVSSRLLLVNSLIEQGICYLYLGERDQALSKLDEALLSAPEDDVALTVRGMLRFRDNRDAAVSDFKSAIDCRTPLVWPYYYLAFQALKCGKYVECASFAEQGISRSREPDILANLFEWFAISQANLDAPDSVIRELFEKALSLAPGHMRIRANQDAYFQRSKGHHRNGFQVPDDVTVAEIDLRRVELRQLLVAA